MDLARGDLGSGLRWRLIEFAADGSHVAPVGDPSATPHSSAGLAAEHENMRGDVLDLGGVVTRLESLAFLGVVLREITISKDAQIDTIIVKCGDCVMKVE